MFRTIADQVWAFDAEWVPDPNAGRRVYGLPESLPDKEVVKRMWKEGGATDEDPTPYLKTVLCRVVSIAAVTRIRKEKDVTLRLLSLPKNPEKPSGEAEILGLFLDAVGKCKPQLVGYNSHDADLRIFIQRAIVNGITSPGFCRRPEKPWEGFDYFSKSSEGSVDLKQIVGGFGKGMPSLNEMAVTSGIPGKMETDGEQVAGLWAAGEYERIVAYNECDALSTYLLWLRIAYFGGHFDDVAYCEEQERVRSLIMDAKRAHLTKFLELWEKLRNRAS